MAAVAERPPAGRPPVSEAPIGQIYLVTTVSMIVGNLSRAPRNARREPPEEG
jgi:hypothetical protein